MSGDSEFNFTYQDLIRNESATSASKEFIRNVSLVSGIFFGVTFFISIVLNTLIILVIVNSKELKRKIFYIFLTSLSVSDLFGALNSPLYWYQETIGIENYSARVFLCPLHWSIKFMMISSTSLHITACVLFRFVGMKFPFYARNIEYKTGRNITIFVWTFCFICALPAAYIFSASDNKNNQCNGNAKTKHIMDIYIRMTTTFLFFLPAVIVTVFTLWIVLSLKRDFVGERNDALVKQRKKETQQITYQLLCTVFGFYVGYAPYTAYAWAHIVDVNLSPEAEMTFTISKAIAVRISECLNPILYNIGSKKMRECTVQYIRSKTGFKTLRKTSQRDRKLSTITTISKLQTTAM